MLAETKKIGALQPYNVAIIHAGPGEKDAAFAALEQAFKDRSYLLAVYFNTDERLASVQYDPRFDDLRRRIGLPTLQN